MTVTINDIRAAVEAIRAKADDNDEAHEMEDRLYKAVLRAIADSDSFDAEGLKLMAMAALKASEIEFARWYA